MEFSASDEVLSCSPQTLSMWLRRRLSESKMSRPSTVEEIEANLRGRIFDLRCVWLSLMSYGMLQKPRQKYA